MAFRKLLVIGTLLLATASYILYIYQGTLSLQHSLEKYHGYLDDIFETKPTENLTRIAVICYIPGSVNEVQLFISLLYGSWRYITKHRDTFDKTTENLIDLLVFCHPSIAEEARIVCNDKRSANGREGCYAINQSFEIDISYGPINSFVMFKRKDIREILRPYKYVLRTDYDVFLTPALLLWKPKYEIITGEGGYTVLFNERRLVEISKKLGLKHRGIHNVGSTWFGETQLFIKLSLKTLELTEYMYKYEFRANLKGLKEIELQKNPDGKWPEWWRPVSLLYGGELAANHMISNFSVSHKGGMDTPSCSDMSLWKTPHIHCWHSDCEFQKFKFIANLADILQARNSISGSVVHRIFENMHDRDVGNMSVAQYSTFIAWHSAGKYLRKWYL